MSTSLDRPGEAPRPPVRRDRGERLAAWLYTGPLGHLFGAAADIAALWLMWGVASARARIRAIAD